MIINMVLGYFIPTLCGVFFYSVHLFYLLHSHPNMATCCDTLRHCTGTALGQKSKLKRNSARLSFDICPSGKRGGDGGVRNPLAPTTFKPLTIIPWEY